MKHLLEEIRHSPFLWPLTQCQSFSPYKPSVRNAPVLLISVRGNCVCAKRSADQFINDHGNISCA
jgi:hypothetical protein